MKSWRQRWGGCSSGQAMLEYAIAAGMMVAAVAVMALLLYVLKEHGGRMLELVGSEYP